MSHDDCWSPRAFCTRVPRLRSSRVRFSYVASTKVGKSLNNQAPYRQVYRSLLAAPAVEDRVVAGGADFQIVREVGTDAIRKLEAT